MSDPTRRNRLDEEESPYLRQHADNPVNWQPWDERALEAARERDVPIFLSIGYSACHWCHVMAEESFADEEVADVLNETFVPIKVDREERPDVDTVYMTACQLVTGRGGWPLSAWLTPEGEPFHVGTYYPKQPKRGQPGFLDLLEGIGEGWEESRDEIETRARRWTEAVRDELEGTADASGAGGAAATRGDEAPAAQRLESAAEAAVRSADREHGGFGSDGPKFPQPARLRLLLRATTRTDHGEFRAAARETLDAMADGGLYDHVGGGFHRYCVDREWTVPHFEKMLYDQAELARVYLEGYRATGDERYAGTVRETLAFVERELTGDGGGFFATLDARSVGESGEREEGAFYVWTPADVEAVLEDDREAALFRERFGVTEAGNFEGKTVLNVERNVDDLAEEFDLPESEVETRLSSATDRVFDAREERPRPNRDEKVLAGWNGLMISAFAEAALAFDGAEAEGGDERGGRPYAETAVDALEFVREHLWDADEGRLLRRYKDGDVAIDAYLEDYAFLARGALHCYEATGEVDHLSFAVDLARGIEAEFWDADRGTLYFTPERGADLVTRPQDLADVSTPSPTGVAVEVLLALDEFVDDGLESIAATVLDTHAGRVASSPLEHVTLAIAADRLERGALEVTVAAEEVPGPWLEAFGSRHLPDRLLSRRPPTEAGLEPWLERLGLAEAPPIWAGREARGGEPTIYVCRRRTCSPPTRDVEGALEWVGDLSG